MEPTITPSERLQELMKLLRIKSINAFALSIGLKQSVLNNIVAGRQSKPSFDTLEKIKLKYPRVNLDWLVTGIGEPLRPSAAPTSSNVAREESQVQYGNTGNTVGTMAGGSLSYTGEADCQQALDACRGRVRELEGMVADKQLIIELLQKSK